MNFVTDIRSYRFMKRLLANIILTGMLLLSLQVQGQDNYCIELLKDEDDLDLVYEQSELVFIARISPRNNLNTQIFNFRRFDPVLKGNVPEEGFITFADNCYPKTEDAIYLFMLNSLDERIEGFNAIFFSLPDGGPGYTWIADWVEMRIDRKAGVGSRGSE